MSQSWSKGKRKPVPQYKPLLTSCISAGRMIMKGECNQDRIIISDCGGEYWVIKTAPAALNTDLSISDVRSY